MLGSGRRKEDSASVLPEMFSALLQDSFGRETFRGWNPKVRIHHETHQKGITLRLVVLPESCPQILNSLQRRNTLTKCK